MAVLSPDIVLRAYAVGLFPMAEHHNDAALYWIDPEKRGILPLERFRIPRRLRRTVRQNLFQVKCDTAFEDVIRLCAERANDRKDTWINDEIINLYVDLFEIGRAHSVETWLDGKLVGGLYGVTLGSAFFGESMFSRESDASKIALAYLVKRLKTGAYTLLDTQFLTSHLSTLGAIQLTRDQYLERLKYALKRQATFFPNY